MKSFVPRKYQKADKRNRNSYQYNQDPGPVNPPTTKPFIRIYCKFRVAKPKDLVGFFMVWTQHKIDPDKLHEELNKIYPKIQVFTIIQDRHFVIILETQKRWDKLEQVTRKIIEAMQS